MGAYPGHYGIAQYFGRGDGVGHNIDWCINSGPPLQCYRVLPHKKQLGYKASTVSSPRPHQACILLPVLKAVCTGSSGLGPETEIRLCTKCYVLVLVELLQPTSRIYISSDHTLNCFLYKSFWGERERAPT